MKMIEGNEEFKTMKLFWFTCPENVLWERIAERSKNSKTKRADDNKESF